LEPVSLKEWATNGKDVETAKKYFQKMNNPQQQN